LKRTLQRPWGRKHKGGWVIWNEEFLKAIKGADVIEMNGVTVGARQLRQILKLLTTDDCLLVKANGRLEVETIARVIRKKNGHRRTSFRKPRLEQSFRIDNKAWMPINPGLTVVIKPRKYA